MTLIRRTRQAVRGVYPDGATDCVDVGDNSFFCNTGDWDAHSSGPDLLLQKYPTTFVGSAGSGDADGELPRGRSCHAGVHCVPESGRRQGRHVDQLCLPGSGDFGTAVPFRKRIQTSLQVHHRRAGHQCSNYGVRSLATSKQPVGTVVHPGVRVPGVLPLVGELPFSQELFP